eukprot:2451817-Pleurochrysis_carterae.AAC.2
MTAGGGAAQEKACALARVRARAPVAAVLRCSSLRLPNPLFGSQTRTGDIYGWPDAATCRGACRASRVLIVSICAGVRACNCA